MKGSFAQGIKAFQQKLEANLTDIIRKVVLDAQGRIVTRSPVETGRFKANNQISLNGLPAGSLLAFDKDGSVTIAKGQAEMLKFSLGDTVFIANNLAYALAIEEGHSKRAPQGVYRIAAAEMIEQLQAYAKAGV